MDQIMIVTEKNVWYGSVQKYQLINVKNYNNKECSTDEKLIKLFYNRII